MKPSKTRGSRKIGAELAAFLRVLSDEIAAHNARPGRRTPVCQGRSFDEAFAASYAEATVRKASAEQLRQMLLAAEIVTASGHDGSVRLAGNRYWMEALVPHAGQKLLLRFDPDALHTSVSVYTLSVHFVGEAPCTAAVGFADTQAGREHTRAKKQYRRAMRAALEAERRMSAAEVADQLPAIAEAELPETTVIEAVFGNTARLQIVSLSFQDGNKWRLSDGENSFFATILDDAFNERVAKREEHFSKDDLLRARIRRRQFVVDGRLRSEYEIVQVLRHDSMPPVTQAKLDLPPPDSEL
jgi:hypothetical protein